MDNFQYRLMEITGGDTRFVRPFGQMTKEEENRFENSLDDTFFSGYYQTFDNYEIKNEEMEVVN